ncbi:hypothetical protein LOTGIDRAFT_105579 [Lottia gigantea]|uniref:G-protein coupled receptors family 1 profile domain-containing protein n=1 Tax=Lottia gigantea TaxID=225164 RepID=V4BQW3_LOTGI|nr:hypothetical protein LOTGIDRAFT_105579 [Lottia gigantea]ESO91304.1 hypothetical protein LOTGIDRAFT_105579 [Lottia gigantea]
MENDVTFHAVVTWIRNIFIPANSVVGITGNFLALAVFTASHQRHLSSSGYLGALACADNLFLITLFISWFDGIVPIMLTKEFCRFVIFTTYVSSFLSVWYVVCFTCERYIAICHPLKAPMILAKVSEKTVVIVLAILASLMYSFAIWTTTVASFHGRNFCVPDQSYLDLMSFVTWVDTVITMIVPFLMIAVMNIRIVYCVYLYQHKRRFILQSHQSTPVKAKSQMKITKILLLVSTTFLVLNLPSHAIRLERIIVEKTDQAVPLYKTLVQELAQYIYYATFSVNFFLYAIYGKHFKKSLNIMLHGLCKRHTSRNKNPQWSYSEYNRTSMTSMNALRVTNGSISPHGSDV